MPNIRNMTSYIHVRVYWLNDPSDKIYYNQTYATEKLVSNLQSHIEEKLHIPIKYQELSYNGRILNNPLTKIGSISKNNTVEIVLTDTQPETNNIIVFDVVLSHRCKYGREGSRHQVIINEHATFYELTTYLVRLWDIKRESLLYLLEEKYYNHNSIRPIYTVLNKKKEINLAILDTC